MNYKHNKEFIPLAKTLRKNMTKEEKHLWYDYLRGYPTRFIRQKAIGKYIVDFYCADYGWRIFLFVDKLYIFYEYYRCVNIKGKGVICYE